MHVKNKKTKTYIYMNRKARESVKNVFTVLNRKKVFIPLFLSFAAMALIIYFDKSFTLSNFLLFKEMSLKGLFASIAALIVRDFLYVLRIRLLVNKNLRWSSCFIIIMLWEFSSAVTPSAVGGGFVAVFLFLHEGISFGEAMAYVLLSAIFDNYFFILGVPLSYLGLSAHSSILTNQWLNSMFWLSYGLICFYASLMTFFLFFKPELFKALMCKITSLKFLKKFHEKAIEQGDNLISSSHILKQHSLGFWMVILLITLVTWFSRYIILNFIISGFVDMSFREHIVILCKHLVMWITMLISPSPGGSGFVEYCFNNLYKDVLGNYTIIIVLVWRFLTFYIYIFSFLFILPSWLRSFKKNKKKELPHV